ncbi:hypothetical protein GCM10020331_045270 [Ectobacillus funiculus]
MIKVLKEAGIPIDMIAGSSMGALVAVFYAAGSDVERLYQIAKLFKRKYYLDFTVPKMGFISGKRVKDMIRALTYNRRLEELDIPTAVVATDILTGEKGCYDRRANCRSSKGKYFDSWYFFVPEKKWEIVCLLTVV